MWKACWIALALAGSASAEPFLAGRVLDAGGAAVPGAVVSVLALDARWQPVAAAGAALPLSAPLAAAATDEAGTFRIDAAAVPPGLHVLAIAPPDAAPLLRWRERIAFGAAALPADIELRLPARTSVTGLVLDESGAPVPGAQITALSASSSEAMHVTVAADATGRFSLPAARDAVLTLVGVAGARWGITRAPLADAPEAVLAIHVAPLEPIEGTVVTRDGGKPVAGVRVRALAPSWDPLTPTADEATLAPWGRAPILSETTTGDDGRYALRVPPGGLALTSGSRTMAMRALAGRTTVDAAKPLRGVVVDERGAPVAGADVRWSELPETAITDELGRFELPPNVNAAVIATTPDGAVRSLSVEAMTQDIRLIVPPLQQVSGTVAGADGAPAPGVTLRATTAAWDVLTATDSEGRFAVSLRGVRRIVARSGSMSAEWNPAPGLIALKLVAAPASAPRAKPVAPIRVTVSDDAGPLEGATARSVASRRGELPATPIPTAGTAASGLALLSPDSAEEQDVLVTRPGRAQAWLRGVRPGASVSVRLAAGATLQGIVRDGNGAPVASAAIVSHLETHGAVASPVPSMPQRSAAQSDASGRYLLRDLPAGTHAVEVVALGFAASPRQRVTLVAGRATTLDLTVAAGATLRGVVRDAQGPIAGAQVKVSAFTQTFSGDGFGAAGGWRGAYTSEDGSFAIEGLEPEQWYSIDAEAAWHAPGSGGGRPSETVVDIVLTATGAIAGSAEGESEGVMVSCAQGDGTPSHAEIVEGAFALASLEPGTYRCSFEGSLAAATLEKVEVRAGAETTVRVRLEDKPSVVIEVLAAASGAPIEGAVASLADSFAETDALGQARLALPARGEAVDSAGGDDALREVARWERTVEVRAPGHEQASAELPSPLPKLVTIRLRALPMLRGRVVGADALPAAGADLLWGDAPTGVLTGADGRFEIPDIAGLPTEVLRARRMIGGVTEDGSAEVAGDGSEIVITMSRAEAAELTVLVRDAEGPVLGARVSVLGELLAQGATDAEGRFTASRLPAGTVGVIVETESGAMAMKKGIVLVAGQRTEEEIVLGEGWSIDGRVVSAGRPVEGAQVSWFGRAGAFGAAVVTRADGSFRSGPIPNDEEAVRLFVMTPQRTRTREAGVRRGDPPVVVNIAATRIIGRVLASDEPVVAASLRFRCEGSSGGGAVHADSSGAFAIEDMPADSACDLLVRAEGRPALSMRIRTPGEGLLDLGDIRLETRVIRGHASFPAGLAPRELALVLTTAEGARVGGVEALLRPDGTFEVAVSQVPLNFVAWADGLGWIAGILDNASPLELSFEQGAILEIAGAGPGSEEAYVGIVEWNGRLAPGGVGPTVGTRMEAGRATLAGLPAGLVVIEARGGSGEVRAEAHLLPGETTRITITLP